LGGFFIEFSNQAPDANIRIPMQMNPYQPTDAPVADVVPADEVRVRPRQVLVAVVLLSLSLALTPVQWAVDLHSGKFDGLSFGFGVLSLVIGVILNRAIFFGQAWARLVTLLLFCLLLVLLFWMAAEGEFNTMGTTDTLIFIAEVLLDGAALWLLYRQPGTGWFQRTEGA
jgi:hypothetical protein